MVRRLFLALALVALALPGRAQSSDPQTNFTYLASGGAPYILSNPGTLFGAQAANTMLMCPDGGGVCTFRNFASFDDYRKNSLPSLICKDTAVTDIVSTVTESVLYACAVPANALGTSSIIRFQIRGDNLHNNAVANDWTLKAKYGCADGVTAACGAGQNLYSGSLQSGSSVAVNAVRRQYSLTVELRALAATNSQNANLFYTVSIPCDAGGNFGVIDNGCGGGGLITAPTARVARSATTTVDDTALSYFMITITPSANSINFSYRKTYAYAEVLP